MSKLIKSFILARCSDPEHIDCISVKDAVFAHPRAIEAYTTNVDMSGSTFCVAATFVSESDEIPKIKKQLSEIKTKSPKLNVAEIKSF